MLDLPTFSEWFAAINSGLQPLPWQARLAGSVVGSGWPSLIGVPTGLGKTACLDIAIWALAADAERSPAKRNQPRRIWYVVNRRLLVDAAAQRAERLAASLAKPASTEVGAVAAALRRLGGLGKDPLHVTSLRGGAPLGVRPTEPSQPTIVLATPVMFGSRWLFRGFGTSVGMRSIDAALAGVDSLVLLDEAHLSQPLLELADSVPAADFEAAPLLPGKRSRPSFVSLTATGRMGPGRFDLNEADLAHPVVRARIDAAKPTTLVASTKVRLIADLAKPVEAWAEEPGQAGAALVFTNAPRTARAVFELLGQRIGHMAEMHLVTGRMREFEAGTERSAVLDGARAGRPPEPPRDQPMVIVATQTLEVGADLDTELLVTESAGARAIVQRFGRCNRLGDKNDVARATIVHAIDAESRLYGTEPGEIWERLLAAAADGPLDLRPAFIAEVVGPPDDQGPPAPILLPGLLWEWAKTTVAPKGEAPVELYIQGMEEQDLAVAVCWRAVCPSADPLASESDGPDGRLFPPITADEVVAIPVGEVRDALANFPTLQRLTADRASLEPIEPSQLRPGDTVVLLCRDGHYDRHGWNPSAREHVIDVAVRAARLVRLDEAAIRDIAEKPSDAVADLITKAEELNDTDLGPELENELLDQFLRALEHPDIVPREPIGWPELVSSLREANGRPVPLQRPASGAPFLQGNKKRQAQAAKVRLDAFDDLSFGVDVTDPALPAHLASVGETARALAEAIGLPLVLAAACGAAGSLHDIGKHDPRFQRWLGATTDTPMAKSAPTQLSDSERARVASGWPRGGRHETLSLRLARGLLASGVHALAGEDVDNDLVLHLVASHHGHGRPSLPTVGDSRGILIAAVGPDHTAVTIDTDLSHPEWEQPARFRHLCERYGLWGLALLEAVVRQADHVASAAVTA